MIAYLIISSLAVWLTAALLPGVEIVPWWAAVAVAIVLGLINTFIRPLCKLVAMPLNFLTLGLFTFVINALMVLLCAWVLPDHFIIAGNSFLWALAFSVVLSVVNCVLNFLLGRK